VKLWLAALVFTVLLPGCATAQSRVPDVRPEWRCSSRTNTDGIDVMAIRTLDAQGQQLDAEVQWSIGGFDTGRLSLMALQRIRGAGDPPAQPREILVSWSGFPDRLQRERLLIVLHASDEPQNALDGVAMIPYVNGLIGAAISWQGVRALARNSPSAQLTLLDPRGHPVRSTPVDLSRLSGIVERAHAALDDSRAKAAKFRKRCEQVTR